MAEWTRQYRKCYGTPVTLKSFLCSAVNFAFITAILPRSADVPSAARPAPEQPTREELPRGSFLRRDLWACWNAEEYRPLYKGGAGAAGPLCAAVGLGARVGACVPRRRRHGLRGP